MIVISHLLDMKAMHKNIHDAATLGRSSRTDAPRRRADNVDGAEREREMERRERMRRE